MVKKRVMTVQLNPSNTETAEYLKKVSQSTYNLRKIIDAHLTEPVEEDKDLNSFYLEEINTLRKLLESPVGLVVVASSKIKLSQDLMFNRGKTKSAQKGLDNADDFIRIALGKVQKMRQRHYGDSIPHQGLEAGPLKDYLSRFLAKKQKIIGTPTVTNVAGSRTGVLEDVIVGPLRYEANGSVSFKGIPIKMRSQLNVLCHLFMSHHKKLLEKYTILDELVEVKKRSTAKKKNINKYVSELHILLKKHFDKNVIFNHKKEGYIFDIDQSS